MRYVVFALILLSLFSFIPFTSAHIFDKFINLQIDPVGSIVAEVEPTGEHTFYFKYYNGGTLQANIYAFYTEFRVEVEGDGWRAYVSPTWTYFYPNETKIGYVKVVASSRPSNYAIIHLYGRIRDIYGNWYYGNFTFRVKSAPYHSFDVILNKTYIKAKQEEIYSVPIKIKNYGNYEDYFEIIPIYIPSNWKLTISQTRLILPPGGEAIVYVHFATPPEGIYIQATTHLILLEVRASGSSPKMAAIIISMEGFHLTLGQMVAILSSMPSIFMLLFVGVSFYRINSPSYIIPKPWIEEKEEIEKLDKKTRKRVLGEMKEEWKSAYYFYKNFVKDEKKLEKLRREKEKKQRKLEEKIKSEWYSTWNELIKTWKDECQKIKNEYEKRKKRIDELISKANRLAMKKGLKIDIPAMPSISYPPEPKKPPMPKAPQYRLDEKRLLLIKPDEIEIEKALTPLRKNKAMAKGEILKIKEKSNEIIEKMKASFNTIERKLIMEIKKLEK